jgi:hypothetical protein
MVWSMKQEQFSEFVDSFNRLAKLDLDLGEADDPEAAVERLKGYSAHVAAGPEVVTSVPHQIALLSFVNITARFALGGVTVSGIDDAPLLVPGNETSLSEAVAKLGGEIGPQLPDVPTVLVGSAGNDEGFKTIQLTFEGWRGGLVPLGAKRLDETKAIAPAAVLSAAMGAAEIFAMFRGEPMAGYRKKGLSLWQPDGDQYWLSKDSDGPALVALPTHLWILGLGHLGQAFLWAMSMCPYADRSGVRLVLQDTDRITGSTKSTSLLTFPEDNGYKTRQVAEHLEALGFTTTIVERPFDAQFRRRRDDPSVLICGVDNALARSQVEEPGFDLIVEAGLGRTSTDYQAMRLHTFPSQRQAKDIWKAAPLAAAPQVSDKPGYRRLREEGVDDCGLTRLAETAIGAPFVGGVAACLMLGQVLRLLHGEDLEAIINIDLNALDARRAVASSSAIKINPGYQRPC